MPDITSRLTTALADRYAVERELGEGGMATVYLAEDLKHKRMVAVKVLRPELAAVLGPERFVREIEIAARLIHPHILPLFDSGEADGFLYYVMPYVEGQTLRDKMDHEGELPVSGAIKIIREVLDALAFAHSKGVVHRDIKPDNVMLTGGHAIVADFGIAKAVSEATGRDKLTTAGVVLGTPAYMAPEQATADPHVDHRADIYAVGVMAYELLAGRPPFDAATPQAILAAHVTQDAEPVSKYRGHVSAELEALVMKCLEKKPADRWQSADEILPQLESLSTPSGRLTPTDTRPVATVARRSQARTVSIGVAALVLAAVGAWSVFFRPSIDSGLDPDLLAVAPFDVLGSGVEQAWGEDLAVLLRNSLDGVGAIRTTEARYTIGQWQDLSEASTSVFGRKLGSGLVVTGTLVGAGQDSVRVTATVFDVEKETPLGPTIELRLGSDRIDNVADSVALRIIRGLNATRDDVGAFQLRSIGSSNPSAIRAFLQGERHYRAATLDSARLAYQRALDEDSTFTLALSRIAMVLGWDQRIGDPAPYRQAAGALNRGLAPRESLLVTVDSIWGSVGAEHMVEYFRPNAVSRLFSTLELATRRYPNDPQIWYQLGEARFHFGWASVTEAQIKGAFSRAIELDSGLVLAYIHFLNMPGTEATKRRGIDEFLAKARPGGAMEDQANGYRLAQALMDPEAPESTTAQRVLETEIERPNRLLVAYELLELTVDSAEVGGRVMKILYDEFGGGWKWGVVAATAFRGHLEDASELLNIDTGATPDDVIVFTELALLGAIAEDSAAAVFDQWNRERMAFGTPSLWWAAKGDTTSLLLALRNVEFQRDSAYSPGLPLERLQAAARDWGLIAPNDSLVSSDSADVMNTVREKGRWTQDVNSLRANLALARGDTAEALNLLEALPPTRSSSCTWCHHNRMLLAQLLIAQGRDQEAADLLDKFLQPPGGWKLPLSVVWRFERGRVHERLGNREKAIEAYSFVIDAWRNADAVLQENYVTPAREGLARLVREQ